MTNFWQQFENLYQDQNPLLGGPDWIKELRSENFSQFKSSDWPSRKNEEWRYTNIKSLLDVEWKTPSSPKNIDLSHDPRVESLLSAFSNRFVFVNGQLHTGYSKNNSLEGVTVLPVSDVLESHAKLLKSLLSVFESQTLVDLNRSFSGFGSFISVDRGYVAREPLLLLHYHDGETDSLSQPQNFVRLSESSELTLFEVYLSRADTSLWTNSLSSFHISQNAQLHHVCLQDESLKSFHLSHSAIEVERDGRAQTFRFDLGSKLSRNNTVVRLLDQNASCSVDGLYVLDGDQHCDNHTSIDHSHAQTFSHQLYKGLLDDQSRAVFNGKVFVRQDAQKIEGQQLNKNLLLSPKAKVDTKPQLEISADDVTCTHGATVGQLDDDQIFYLESRGIPRSQARDILIHGFADDALERISSGSIRQFCESLFHKKIA